jgi:hypothetical protein
MVHSFQVQVVFFCTNVGSVFKTHIDLLCRVVHLWLKIFMKLIEVVLSFLLIFCLFWDGGKLGSAEIVPFVMGHSCFGNRQV